MVMSSGLWPKVMRSQVKLRWLRHLVESWTPTWRWRSHWEDTSWGGTRIGYAGLGTLQDFPPGRSGRSVREREVLGVPAYSRLPPQLKMEFMFAACWAQQLQNRMCFHGCLRKWLDLSLGAKQTNKYIWKVTRFSDRASTNVPNWTKRAPQTRQTRIERCDLCKYTSEQMSFLL